MDCSPPETWAEIAEWRPDGGLPSDIHGALLSLGDDLVDAAAAGCPPLDTSAMPFTWSGSCETESGYALTSDGMSWSGSDGMNTEGGYTIVATFAPGASADGSWPTGTITLAYDMYVGGSDTFGSGRQGITATWTFEDAGATGLPLVGTFEGERRSSWGGGCGGDLSRFSGVGDGCAFESEHGTAGYAGDEPDVVERHAVTVGDWSAEVRLRACGTREGTHDGARALLDDAWGLLPHTDADGDGCAVEDCDCDDADPTIRPGAEDPVGDGLDRDCNRRDEAADGECPGVVPYCPDSAVLADTGPSATGPSDTGPSDTGDTGDTAATADAAADEASARPSAEAPRGCATTPHAGAGLIVAIAALARRRGRS